MAIGIIYDYNSRKAEITDFGKDGYYKKLYYFRQNQLYEIERNYILFIKSLELILIIIYF